MSSRKLAHSVGNKACVLLSGGGGGGGGYGAVARVIEGDCGSPEVTQKAIGLSLVFQNLLGQLLQPARGGTFHLVLKSF